MKAPATSVAITLLALLPIATGRAADLFGLYIGGSIAQARLEAAENVPTEKDVPIPEGSLQTFGPLGQPYSGVFSKHASAFKVMAGIRPLSFLGVEVAYDDFGRVAGSYSDAFQNPAFDGATASMKGESAFGVVYLPVPHFDLFVKAGVAVIRSRLTANTNYEPICPPGAFCPDFLYIGPVNVDRTNSALAAGAGAQFKLGHFANRDEYERFTAAGAHPELLSLGMTWSL